MMEVSESLLLITDPSSHSPADPPLSHWWLVRWLGGSERCQVASPAPGSVECPAAACKSLERVIFIRKFHYLSPLINWLTAAKELLVWVQISSADSAGEHQGPSRNIQPRKIILTYEPIDKVYCEPESSVNAPRHYQAPRHNCYLP